MKKIRVFLLFQVVLAVLLLVGCDELPLGDTDLPLEGAARASAEATSVEADGIRVSAWLATEELLRGYDEYLDLTWFEEGDQRVAFTANVLVHDFSILELGYEDGEFYAGRPLIVQKELLPNRPLVVTWAEQEGTPNRGISFADEAGETRYFILEINQGGAGNVLLSLREFFQ